MGRGTMHAPKNEATRRRRNAPTHGETVLPRDDAVRGPELAELTAGREFRPETTAWFETWRRSPQAAVFEATDWLRLATLAPIVDAYWRRPSAAALSEIRMNEERLGATVVDRMRARMRIETDEDADEDEGLPAGVTSLTQRRAELRDRLA
ncbi:phage terminase small subunit [Micromonospora sediminicola]|uniref:phage terminase small subunit n=1 Tax=Micromonospora sediminicola TaxID=946078 RepID=UPI0037AA00A2